MLRDTPYLKGKVKDVRSRDSGTKESIVYKQLKTISVENLKENPEETFYAINGMRFVVEAFETSVCTPPSRRLPIEPIPLGTWT